MALFSFCLEKHGTDYKSVLGEPSLWSVSFISMFWIKQCWACICSYWSVVQTWYESTSFKQLEVIGMWYTFPMLFQFRKLAKKGYGRGKDGWILKFLRIYFTVFTEEIYSMCEAFIVPSFEYFYSIWTRWISSLHNFFYRNSFVRKGLPHSVESENLISSFPSIQYFCGKQKRPSVDS